MRALRGLVLCGGALLAGAAAADEAATLAQCAAAEDPGVRLACYDALARRPAAAEAPGVTPPLTPPAPPTDSFGKPQEDPSIDARIVGSFITWKRGTLVKLDNGQVWRVVDESGEYYPDLEANPEVTITRGLTGYRMTIKAIRKKVGVKRVS